MRALLRLVSTAALIALAAPAFAGTIRVPKDQPTIQAAVDVAGPGDVILIQGTIQGPVVIEGKSGLRIRGARRATIDAAGANFGFEMRDCNDVTVSQLAFSDTVGSSVGTLFERCGRLTLDRCVQKDAGELRLVDCGEARIVRCAVFGSAFNGIIVGATSPPASSADCVIERCRVEGSSASAIFAEGLRQTVRLNRAVRCRGDGIRLSQGAEDSVMTRNFLADIEDRALRVGGVRSLCERNRVRGLAYGGGVAVDFRSNGSRVIGNRISDTEYGVLVFDGAVACVVERNSVSLTRSYGLLLEGTGNSLLANEVSRPTGDGIVVTGSGHQIDRNSVELAGGDGIEIDGNGVSCNLNEVVRCGGNGIDVNGTLCSVAVNRVERASGYGFVAAQGGSNFNGNRSTKSGLGGFQDAPGGGNVVSDNDFR